MLTCVRHATRVVRTLEAVLAADSHAAVLIGSACTRPACLARGAYVAVFARNRLTEPGCIAAARASCAIAATAGALTAGCKRIARTCTGLCIFTANEARGTVRGLVAFAVGIEADPTTFDGLSGRETLLGAVALAVRPTTFQAKRRRNVVGAGGRRRTGAAVSHPGLPANPRVSSTARRRSGCCSRGSTTARAGALVRV